MYKSLAITLMALQLLLPGKVFAEEVCVPVDYNQTCKIINGIRVCDKEYIPGIYVCRHFASDFDDACEEHGIPCWRVDYLFYYSPIEACVWGKPSNGHAVNIIQVEPPIQTIYSYYCLVEPQSNSIYGCWFQDKDEDPVPPPWCETEMLKYFSDLQENLDNGWKPVWELKD